VIITNLAQQILNFTSKSITQVIAILNIPQLCIKKKERKEKEEERRVETIVLG